MAREIKLDIATGRVKVAGVPPDDADDATKAAAIKSLLDEMGPELDALEGKVASDSRGALLEAYQHLKAIEAHPRNWAERSMRRTIGEYEQRIEKVRDAAIESLGQAEGKQIWEDLPYVLETLELLHAKQRTEDEVKRLILTPLGKLEHFKIDYQRNSADDLQRVCQEVTTALRESRDLDEEMLAWGPDNRAAILHQRPLVKVPEALLPKTGGAMAAIASGVLTTGAIGAIPFVFEGVPKAAAAAALIGLGPLAFGAMQLKAAGALKAALPGRFTQLSAKFRERLYLVCALRTLNGFRSKLTIAVEALRTHLQSNGGQQRWKHVKFEGRDMTELFAHETWDPRGTVELWLNEKVQEQFRLDSTRMSNMDELDEEDWGIMLQAFELDALDLESSTEGRLLDSVSHLLFTKRGEDSATERKEVFARVRAAWEASSLATRGAST
tara:strand:+ start:1682 stop:3004 length:1323 start_codon:yes stop_codon:yes gene_type:complete